MTPNERLFLNVYIDQVQAEHESLRTAEARQVLEEIYTKVANGMRQSTTARIFGGLRERLLQDLAFLQTAGALSNELTEAFKKDPGVALPAFLNSVYAAILDHVATAGGLIVNETAAVPATQAPIEVTEQLSIEDERLLRVLQRGEIAKA